jgi:hypothetical protein
MIVNAPGLCAPAPVYGDGHSRFATGQASVLQRAFAGCSAGTVGEVYNVGGWNENLT